MTALRFFCALAFLTILGVPAQARTPERPHLSFKQALSGVNDFTIPASWAGVWRFRDSTRTCGDIDFNATTVDSVVLCAGQTAGPGNGFQCTGNVSDNSADLTCGFSADYLGCLVTYQDHIQITRSGDNATLHTTTTMTSSPAGCAGDDTCEEEFQTLHRVAGPPATCTTATRKSTWGSLKLLYR